MIKNIKTTNLVMEGKFFQNTKCSCFILHQKSMLYDEYNLFLFSKDIHKKNGPMFYSNSNDDKNYVI
jgi:hypothetical protein